MMSSQQKQSFWIPNLVNIIHLFYIISSSVARGGAGGARAPPIGLGSMQKRMYFVLLRPIFCEKWKIAPPIRKEPPSDVWTCETWEKNHSELWRRPFFFFFFFLEITWFWAEKRLNFGFRPKNHSEFWGRPFFFFFWRSPNFGRKKPLNFGSRPKNHSEFWRRPFFFFFFFFFFWRSPNFGRKKSLNFRCFRDISSQISDKPSETDSRSMKIRVNVVCTLLTLSK